MRLPTFILLALAGTGTAYDPLAPVGSGESRTGDFSVHDAARNREIPLRIHLPGGTAKSPVVLFSHGLGGSNQGCAYLGRHWASRGYVAVFLQHPGSDTSVWQDEPAAGRMQAMQKAASGANFMLRAKDVPAVLDQLARWNAQADHPLHGRLDLDKVGMSGHSFGAVTTQAVSGQAFGLAGPRLTDPRIDAAIAFSPSVPARGNPERAFGSVEIPWLLMTGTLDTSMIRDITVDRRTAVFPALPPGNKYLLVLDKAEHSAFTDRALPGDRQPRNPNHHRAVLALSTAFWDAFLRGDEAAKTWLDGPGARSVLEERDRWERR